jgi:hypothetical protein
MYTEKERRQLMVPRLPGAKRDGIHRLYRIYSMHTEQQLSSLQQNWDSESFKICLTVSSEIGSQDRKGGGAGLGDIITRKMQLHYRAMLMAQQIPEDLIHNGTFVTLIYLTCVYL